MTDKSAKPLSAPAGIKDGLTRVKTSIDWFKGQRKVDVFYVVNGRIVALSRLEADEIGVPTVYGDWKDGFVTRTSPENPVSFVAGHWLSSKPMVNETLLSLAMTRFLPALDEKAHSLRIDDGAVLGLSDATEDTTNEAENWSVSISGELTVPGLPEQILLRPTVVRLKDGTLEFEEPGATADNELTLEFELNNSPVKMSTPKVSLDYAISMLLDEKIDGAWERPSPLWLPTTTGMLRIGQGQQKRSPYRFFSESRNLEVRRWFPALGAGASARLMLDQSGRKSLTVRENADGHGVTLTLSVQKPALVFVLPGLAVDGSQLLAPRQPPGAAAVARAVPLQLVPVHLCGDEAGAWSLSAGTEMTLRWRAPDQSGTSDLTHFTRHDDWVLPPAAAVNDVPGISPLRVLIPMLSDERNLRFGLRADNGSAGLLIEAPGFNRISPEATDFGPLASFASSIGTGDTQCKEMWPGAAENLTFEPAVLRAAYRLLSSGMEAYGALASFSSTRVRKGSPSSEADLEPSALTSEDKASGIGWAYRPGSGNPEQRYEQPSNWPNDRFGWMDMQFLSPALVALKAQDTVPGALAWGQLHKKDGQYFPTQWIRLGDDSLTQLPREAVGSEDAAIKALAEKDIVLDLGRLMDDASQKLWGLAQLHMVETISNDKSTLVLHVGNGNETIDVAQQHGVSRIVMADAKSRAVAIDMAPAVKTVLLNRVYLELERRGGRLVLARGMLGWSVSRAFGWERKGGAGSPTPFHVTERFERVAGVLQRTVEFNGVLSRQFKGTTHSVDLYFWDAVLKPAATTLRVICHYQLQLISLRSICALQDARLLPDNSLDLSADIAIQKKSSNQQDVGLSNPWEPDRRKLYQLQIDTRPAIYDFAGFLRVRMAETDNVPTPVWLDFNESVRIVPAWDLSDRELVPWFGKDNAMPSPERDSWTTAGLLRTEPAAKTAGNQGLDLMLYGNGGGWDTPYACTLIETQNNDTGLPLWLPSPVQISMDKAPALAVGAVVPNTQARLWLFDPGPRMIAQWSITDGVDDPSMAKQKALQRLWRMGWTREAVLELPSGTGGEVNWEVVDSPLLNRGASLSWFAGPLAPQAQHPFDVLPATRQVPQTSRGEQQSYSVQVEFEQDLPPSKSGANLVRDSGNANLDRRAPEGLTLRTAGMRVGVQHKVVPYGVGAERAKTTTPLAWPKRLSGAPLSLERGWLSWHSESVDLTGANLKPLPEGGLQYTVPTSFNELRITGAISGLLRKSLDDRWLPVGNDEWLLLEQAGDHKTITLKLAEEPSRWRAMSVTLRSQSPGSPPVEELRTLFPTGGTRLAGVFDRQDKLLAFGEEQTFYLYNAQMPPEGQSTWTRFCGMDLSPQQVAAVKRVITIDLDGQTVQSLMPDFL